MTRSQVAERYLRGAWEGDAHALLPQLVTADFCFAGAGSGRDCDLSGWLEHLGALRSAFEPAMLTVHATLAARGCVCVHYALQARHARNVYGVAASGRSGILRAIAILEFAGMRVRRHAEVVDFFSELAERLEKLR